MAVESGIGATITIDDSGGTGRALSPYCTQFSFTTPRGVQDISSIDASGMKRLLLRSDVQVSATFVFEDTANLSFDVFKTSGTFDSSRTVVIAHSGNTFTAECVLTDCAWNFGADGSLTIGATLQLSNGTDGTWT
jgi:hypothetical protein